MKTLTGVIHGNTIQLDAVPPLAEGAEVEIVIRSPRAKRIPGEGLLRTEGALLDDTDWDGIMDEIHQLRHEERSLQSEPS